MSFLKLESNRDGIEVHLEAESDAAVETPFSSHLLKDALILIIEEAPVTFWEKDDGELNPEEFWAAILGAVSRNYRYSLDVPPDEDVRAPEILRQMIDYLEQSEYL